MTIYNRIVALFGRPDFLQSFHGWATVFWLILSAPVAASSLADKVWFVTWLSLYAAVTGHWSSWQAARVEKKQDEELEQMITTALKPLRREINDLRRALEK